MSYPYQKHIWVTKEVIRREYLQNISDGIYDEQQDRLLKEGLLNDDIVAESNRAKQAEQNITNNLNAEILRAEEAEAAIARDLSSEISRSTTAEGELTDDVADLDARLLDESTRALAAENEISTALANEIARATNVENDLRSITTRAYKPSGSVYFADLPALDVSRLGNVYDIKDAFTTTSDFQEGAGKDYPAGTNVAIVSVEGEFYTEVTPIGTENPSQEGWYVLDDDEYILTTDTEVESGTTYYSYSDYKMMYDANSGFIDTSHFVTDTDYATSQKAGIMKPDGTTVTIDNDGTLHGSSGHIIKDGNGTSLTQRASLKFENCTVTDDSTNNQTVVTPTGQQITVDSSLSATSTNPVQNKVIATALNNKDNLKNVFVKETTIPDNYGYSKYLLLFDISTWYTADTSTINLGTWSFIGFGVTTRRGGHLYNDVFEISIAAAYQKATSDNGNTLRLRSDNNKYTCHVISDGTKYYLALRASGSGRNLSLIGRFIGTYIGTWVECTDSNGTMPSGWSVVISNSTNYSEVRNIAYDGNTLKATREDDSTFNILTRDTTPTSGSSNLITSGGVYNYIDTMITQAISASY